MKILPRRPQTPLIGFKYTDESLNIIWEIIGDDESGLEWRVRNVKDKNDTGHIAKSILNIFLADGRRVKV